MTITLKTNTGIPGVPILIRSIHIMNDKKAIIAIPKDGKDVNKIIDLDSIEKVDI